MFKPIFDRLLDAVRNLDNAKKGKKTGQPVTGNKGGVTKPQSKRRKVPGDVALECFKIHGYVKAKMLVGENVNGSLFECYEIAERLVVDKITPSKDEINKIDSMKYELISITDSCK